MGETFLLTLEVEDNGSVKVQNFKKNVEAAGGATEKSGAKAEAAGKQTAALGKATESTRIGTKVLAEGVESLTMKMGVNSDMSRIMGTSFEGMAQRSFPRWGMALGIAGLAGAAVIGIVTSLIQRKEKLREETIKSATAITDEALGMEKNRKATADMERAQYQLYLLKKRIATRELEDAIAAQTQKILEQTDTINQGGGHWDKFLRTLNQVNIFSSDFYKNGSLSEKWAEQTVRDLQKPRNELEKMVLKLAQMRLQMSQLSRPDQSAGDMFGGGANSEPAYSEFEFAQIREMMLIERAKEAKQQALNDEASYQKQRSKLYEAYGATYEEMQQAELAAFDAVAAAHWETLKTDDEKSAFYVRNEMERQVLLLNHQKQTDTQRVAGHQWAAQTMAQAARTMYEQGGKHARDYFNLYKVASIAEATISMYKSAQDAFTWGTKLGGPYMGYTMAAIAVAAGLANISAIRSQQFGSSSGAVGTYAASSATGLAGGGGGYQYYYEQDPKNPNSYGTGWRPGEGASQNSMYYSQPASSSPSQKTTINNVVNNNLHLDGDVYGFDDFKGKVNKAFVEDYSDRGATFDTVNN